MQRKAPFGLRHPLLFVTAVLGGVLILLFGGVALALIPHLPGLAAGAPLMLAFLTLPRGLRWVNRRRVRGYADDPNVLWAGVAQLDRLELLRAGVEPVPDTDRSGPVVLLLTRTGVALRPFGTRTDWLGVDIPVARVTAACLGKAPVGDRYYPALRLLVAGTRTQAGGVMGLPLLSGDRGLPAALAASALAGRVLSVEAFTDREIDVWEAEAYGQDEISDDADGDSAVTGLAAQRKVRRWRPRSLWGLFAITFGGLLVGIGGGIAMAAIGMNHDWPALAVPGWLLLTGTPVWITWSTVATQRRARQARLAEIAALDTRRARA